MHGLTALPFRVFLLLPRVKLATATKIHLKISFIFVFRSAHVPDNHRRPTRHLINLLHFHLILFQIT